MSSVAMATMQAMDSAAEEQKSSAEILDEIFREIKEKTAAGEVDVTDLTRLIARSKVVLSDSDFESAASKNDVEKPKKHKHKHKHKKKHKRKHSSKHKAGKHATVEWVEGDGGTHEGRKVMSPAEGDGVVEGETNVEDSTADVGLEGEGACTVESGSAEGNDAQDDRSTVDAGGNPTEVAGQAVEGGSGACLKRTLVTGAETEGEAKRLKVDAPFPTNCDRDNTTTMAEGSELPPVAELEEGEVNGDDDGEVPCEADLQVAPTMTTTTMRAKSVKSSKRKSSRSKSLKSSVVVVPETAGADSSKSKKKKKKSKKKKFKRFTAPLALSLTSRSHRETMRSPSSLSSTKSGRRHRKSRSSSPVEKIDKAKLLEIARRNALTMMAQGKLPPGLSVPPLKQEQVVAFKAGGKSVEELTGTLASTKMIGQLCQLCTGKLRIFIHTVQVLTQLPDHLCCNYFCKLLSKKESEEGEHSDDTSKRRSDDEDERSTFLHHPFKLREHQPNIIMKIRNAVQIPVKTQAEKVAESSKLRIQFPVSSGTQHRQKESEWVPVSPGKEQVAPSSSSTNVELETPAALPAPPPSKVAPPKPAPVVVLPPDTVFPEELVADPMLDIGSIVSQRLKAVRKLMENPNDIEALGQMYRSQEQMQHWAQSKQLPGQFTGTTDVTLLTPQQLAGPAHVQAWVRKDQFIRATPVQSRFGMQMLQKMGWKPGEGLGKNKEGAAEPLLLDIKMDKKGLVSQDELVKKNAIVPRVAKDLSGKHPVSALVELCSKRKWPPPEFVVVNSSGPAHMKNFLFKVIVKGCEYQPTVTSLTKKLAKAQCATVCLQYLGLLPRDLQNPL